MPQKAFYSFRILSNRRSFKWKLLFVRRKLRNTEKGAFEVHLKSSIPHVLYHADPLSSGIQSLLSSVSN